MTEEEQMLTQILQCRRVDLYLEQRTLDARQRQAFEAMQARRVAGEPLQYIIGHTDFMGLKIFVDKRVLIPRPETEIMVEDALEIMRSVYNGRTLRVLDVGTGSGNIAVALAKFFPDCRVTAIDSSQKALEAAMTNARFHDVSDRIEFVYREMNDFFNPVPKRNEYFDLVISNPPYIPRGSISFLPKDVQQEPRAALDGGKDGLDHIRTLLSMVPLVLHPNGHLIFEFGDGQSEAIYRIFEYTNTFQQIEFKKDYRQTNRYAVLRLAAMEAASR
jgi:release factor glutamine methyltransferase